MYPCSSGILIFTYLGETEVTQSMKEFARPKKWKFFTAIVLVVAALGVAATAIPAPTVAAQAWSSNTWWSNTWSHTWWSNSWSYTQQWGNGHHGGPPQWSPCSMPWYCNPGSNGGYYGGHRNGGYPGYPCYNCSPSYPCYSCGPGYPGYPGYPGSSGYYQYVTTTVTEYSQGQYQYQNQAAISGNLFYDNNGCALFYNSQSEFLLLNLPQTYPSGYYTAYGTVYSSGQYPPQPGVSSACFSYNYPVIWTAPPYLTR